MSRRRRSGRTSIVMFGPTFSKTKAYPCTYLTHLWIAAGVFSVASKHPISWFRSTLMGQSIIHCGISSHLWFCIVLIELFGGRYPLSPLQIFQTSYLIQRIFHVVYGVLKRTFQIWSFIFSMVSFPWRQNFKLFLKSLPTWSVSNQDFETVNWYVWQGQNSMKTAWSLVNSTNFWSRNAKNFEIMTTSCQYSCNQITEAFLQRWFF